MDRERTRDAVIRATLGDDVMVAMTALRHATDRLVWWPWSQRRRLALHAALEDVMALHVNRVMGSSGRIVVAQTAMIAQLAERVAALEAARDGDG